MCLVDTLKHLFSLILPITVLIVVPTYIESDFGFSMSGLTFAGAGLIVAGLATVVAAITMFIRIGRGTLAPWNPTQKLVVRGMYARVRNPMITGVLAVLLGESLVFRSKNIFVWFVAFFFINYAYFVLFEEPGLEKRFGEEYLEYKSHVPRWIPRLKPWRPPHESSNKSRGFENDKQ
jgi:protein-S-isoprenylcysteine O-methyltransferase Ste14